MKRLFRKLRKISFIDSMTIIFLKIVPFGSHNNEDVVLSPGNSTEGFQMTLPSGGS